MTEYTGINDGVWLSLAFGEVLKKADLPDMLLQDIFAGDSKGCQRRHFYFCLRDWK